jgi:hypothetical protein
MSNDDEYDALVGEQSQGTNQKVSSIASHLEKLAVHSKWNFQFMALIRSAIAVGLQTDFTKLMRRFSQGLELVRLNFFRYSCTTSIQLFVWQKLISCTPILDYGCSTRVDIFSEGGESS